MRMRGTGIAGAILIMAAMPARAAPVAPGTIDEDLRCLAVMASLAGNASGEEQNRIMGGVLYFVGLIEGKAPAADLVTELKRVSAEMSEADFDQAAQRCGQKLQEKGRQLDAIGQALEPSK